MRVLKWLLLFVVWTLIAAFLHYNLPRTDVVRIVNTEVRRVDVGERPMFWSEATPAAGPLATRDVPFIETIDEDGSASVYRNEDTGWGWPPYFKFDSANLQADAADLVSTREAPQWVAVRRYGWRVPMLSAFPNALSLRPVAGPEVFVIPWVAILVLVVLAVLAWAVYVRWRRFRTARLDPRIDAMGASWEERRTRRAEQRRLRRQQRTGI